MTVRFLPLFIVTVLSLTGLFAGPVRLRADHEINRKVIMVSDFFSGVTAKQDSKVLDAPNYGEKLVFTAGFLKELAVTQNLKIEIKPEDKITIERESQVVAFDSFKELVKDKLEELQLYEDYDITFDKKPKAVFANPEAPEIELKTFKLNEKSKRFQARFMVPGAERDEVFLIGHVVEFVELPVLVRDIPNNQAITKDDITIQKVDKKKARNGVALNIDDLIGLAPKSGILKAGQPIAKRRLKKPTVIEKGSIVTAIVKNGPLRITAQVKAMQSGGAGDTIRLKNIKSNKFIEAIVVNSQQVDVPVATTKIIEGR